MPVLIDSTDPKSLDLLNSYEQDLEVFESFEMKDPIK